jgi:hypothetical protein
MKKERVFTIIVVVLLALVFSTGPVQAQIEKEWTGTRTRNEVFRSPITISDCWSVSTSQVAYWTVTADPGPVSHLISGEWVNFNTHISREVIAYVVDDVESPCDPSMDPPEGATTVNGRRLLAHGPFTLTPTEANGGVWQGEWRMILNESGPPTITAKAEGFGGDLHGLKLKIFVVGGGATDAPFNGWVIGPWWKFSRRR